MAKTITALYQDFATANRAVKALIEAGFDSDSISVVANDSTKEYSRHLEPKADSDQDDVSASEGATFGAVSGALIGLGALLIPGIGPVIAAGPLVSALIGAGIGAVAGGVTGSITASLVDLGIDEQTAHHYAEGVRRGGAMLVVYTTDQMSDQAVDILEKYGPLDVDSLASGWHDEEGWNSFDETGEPYSAEQIQAVRSRYSKDDDQPQDVVEVVEEQLKVGKREIETGGVRVRSYVTEKPVEERIELRDEHVTVNRKSVDRPASEAEFDTDDKVYEVRERHEEAVVTKEARVVEEVEIKKQVDQHTETVRETVRRKDVDVERLDIDNSFETYEPRFRAHFNNTYGNTGSNYDHYSTAYRYGYQIAADERYGAEDWQKIEPDVRGHWEERNEGTWDQVKDAIEHAWHEVRQSLST